MKFYKSLASVCEAAINISKRNPGTVVGVFKRFDTAEYYYAYSSTEIRTADDFICQYFNGELDEEAVNK